MGLGGPRPGLRGCRTKIPLYGNIGHGVIGRGTIGRGTIGP